MKLTLKQRLDISRFLRGEAPGDDPITLNQRRIFILPTRRGLGFALLIVLLMLIAFVYGNNLAYFLAFLLAGVFFVTILHTYNALAGLTVGAGQPANAFAGTAAGFVFYLQNPTWQTRYGIHIKLSDGLMLDLPAKQTQTVTLYTPASQRGWLVCGTVTLSACFPLGLFRAWSPLRFDRKLLVYPQPAAYAPPLPQAQQDNGTQFRSRLQGSDEFYGARPYQLGDPQRHIHWKTFAKGRQLQTKQYAGSSDANQLWLDYAVTPGSDREQRLSLLCRWLIDAEHSGLRYGLRLPGQEFAPDRGRKHYLSCLKALALF
ncbi:DUF58 domain-containing protein [Methylomonas sp. HYX-M1]|uniref:DUF58 domain-containing protein n=1 Tax=Methylomonas sp. HYX-M1 TaxID=3139307 RepID=UPI00345B8815